MIGDPPVKEPVRTLVRSDVTELLERARRAREEAASLSDDHRFIVTWYRTRPRRAARTSSMLDGED